MEFQQKKAIAYCSCSKNGKEKMVAKCETSIGIKSLKFIQHFNDNLSCIFLIMFHSIDFNQAVFASNQTTNFFFDFLKSWVMKKGSKQSITVSEGNYEPHKFLSYDRD